MQKKILVLGDSHSRVFRKVCFRTPSTSYTFEVIDVSGATASGLENPNSRTNAYGIFSAALQSIEHDLVVTMLGEVDTGFVIWYRSQTLGIPLADSFAITYDRYCRFVEELGAKVAVISAPLPTIRDNQDWGEIANLRRAVTATQQQRTALTIEFNSLMQSYCSSRSIPYLNLDQSVLGHDGRLRAEYYASDPNDHHYAEAVFARLLEDNLGSIFRPTGSE